MREAEIEKRGAGADPSTEARSIWERACTDLRDSLPRSAFRLWVEPLRPVSLRGSTLFLTAPDHVRAWVERRYAQRVAAALARHHGGVNAIGFLDGDRADEGGGGRAAPASARYRFDRFVIGAGNRHAHAAALAVAELPGEAYNPLFLHGAPGLGKSHLLAAIADYLHHNHPGVAVRHTTAERFTAEFVASLRGDGPARFKRRHRELGALLIDDVQFLEAKPRTEEEFFHTFNTLYEAGAQIVLSSDRPPQALERLADRLRNRFEWGLCVEVSPPDSATRLAVLRRLIAEGGHPVADPVALEEIADRAPIDLRKLEGALVRVTAVASIGGEEITPELVRRALVADDAGDRSPERAEPVTVEEVKRVVADVLHVPASELRSRKRTPALTQARHLAIYVARQLTDLPLVEIGRQFDRDHSTVLHAIRTVSRKLEPDSPLAAALARVHSELSGGGEPGG